MSYGLIKELKGKRKKSVSTPLLYIKYLHAVQTKKNYLSPQILEAQLSRVVCTPRVRPCHSFELLFSLL